MRANQPWSRKAACRGIDAAVFYPSSDADVDSARSICTQCTAQSECLEFALANYEHWGVWGGATESERVSIRRRRQRAARSEMLTA